MSDLEEISCACSYLTKAVVRDSIFVFDKDPQLYLKQGDPYNFKNFQDAVEYLKSNQKIGKELELEPTHYALTIFPKTFKQVQKIEEYQDVKTSDIPFDFYPLYLEEDEIKRDSFLIKELETPIHYYESYDYYYEGGKRICVKYPLPVIYAVWPKDITIPKEFDYSIDYEVFIPNTKSISQRISEKDLMLIEITAISRMMANSISQKREVQDYSYILHGTVKVKDTYLNRNIPVPYLKVGFRLGSNVVETYTDSNGEFTTPTRVNEDASYYHKFQNQYWKVTDSTSTVLMSRIGSVFPLWGDSDSYDFVFSTPTPRYAIFPLLYHYYFGNNPNQTKYFGNGGLRVECPGYEDDNANGSFYYSSSTNPYLKIYDNNAYNTPRLAGTVFHELGHLTQYCNVGGYSEYITFDRFIRESHASFFGWFLCKTYYNEQGYYPSDSMWTFSGQARQNWVKTWSPTYSYAVYSPVLIDLVDTFNQSSFNIDNNNDTISGIPFATIEYLSTNCKNWLQLRNELSNYIGVYYTYNEYLTFIYPYDYWYHN